MLVLVLGGFNKYDSISKVCASEHLFCEMAKGVQMGKITTIIAIVQFDETGYECKTSTNMITH